MDVNKDNTDFRCRETIDVTVSIELLYWSEKYNVSVDKIIETVALVGPLVKNVETSLRRKSKVKYSPA